MFLLPLNNSYEISYRDWTTLPHVIIQPNGSSDLVYEIPFRHNYPFLRTDDELGLGRLRIGVWSPLDYVSGSPVSVSLYLKLNNYMFKIPRAVTDEVREEFVAEGGDEEKNEPPKEAVAPVEKVEEPKPKKEEDKKPIMRKGGKKARLFRRKRSDVKNLKNAKKPQGVKVAKGGKSGKKGGRKFFGKSTPESRAKQSWNSYLKKYGEPPKCTPGEIVYAHKRGWMVADAKTGAIKVAPKNMCQSLLGDMVVAWVKKGKDMLKRGVRALDSSIDALDDVEDLVLDVEDVCDALGFFDNPNVAKQVEVFRPEVPSMSNVSGSYVAKNMDLHPVSNYKPGRFVMDPSEMNLDFLMGREAVVGEFEWTSSDDPQRLLLEIDLDSTLSLSFDDFCVPLAVLNQFQFYHCDYQFRLYVFKTMFHTGRIRAVCGYGEQTGVDVNTSRTGMTQVLDFDSSTTYVDFVVPWVAPLDYLRTYDGPRTLSTNKSYLGRSDFSLGRLRIEVANTLCLASDTVPMSCRCVLTARLVDARVAVPKVTPTVVCPYGYASGNLPVLSFVAEGDVLGESEEVAAPDTEVDEFFPDADVVEEGKGGFTDAHNDLDIGAQFEFIPGNVLDIARRFIQIYPQNDAKRVSYTSSKEGVYNFVIRPVISPITSMFRGFSGGVCVRIYANSNPTKLIWTPVYGGTSDTWVPGSTTPDASVSGAGVTGTLTYAPIAGSFGFPPFEIILPSGGNQGYTDVILPYQQHVFFLTPNTSPNFVLGTLTVLSASSGDQMRVYQKVADDGSFGIFCPPQGYSAGVSVTGFPGYGINGYFM